MWFKRKADTGDSGKDLPITVGWNYLQLNYMQYRVKEALLCYKSKVDISVDCYAEIVSNELNRRHNLAANGSNFLSCSDEKLKEH